MTGRPVVVVQLVASGPGGVVPAGQVSLDAGTVERVAAAVEAWDRRGLGRDAGLVELVGVLRGAVRTAAGHVPGGDGRCQEATGPVGLVASLDGGADGGGVDRQLATLDQVAVRLCMSRRSVQRLVESGELEAVRIGRAVRFDPVELEAFERRNSTRRGA